MRISDIYYAAFNAACYSKKHEKQRTWLYIRWQEQLKREDRFYVYGKPGSILAW